MPTIQLLQRLPQNFDGFVEEAARALHDIYGQQAAEAYRRDIHRNMTANLRHPAAAVLGAVEGGLVAGLLVMAVRGTQAEMSFVHVLAPWTGKGIEQQLIEEAVRICRAGGVEDVVAEFVPCCPLEIDAPFVRLGFERIERQLMSAPLACLLELPLPANAPAPCTPEQWPEAAACIVDAYADNAGQKLHHEVRGIVAAADFIARIAAGNYGAVRPEYLQAVWDPEGCTGVVLGCATAPDIGFVLQLTVRRARQGRGIGTALLASLARAYRDAGYGRMALGVTNANPARRLYERLGFKKLRGVNAYVWQDPPADS